MAELDPKLVKMATATAVAIARRCPRSVLAEDLVQAAMLGLLDGLSRHPSGSGPGWEWYLRCRIRGAVLDELRAQDWCGRRRGGRAHAKVLHLDDVNEFWGDTMPGAGESPEEQAMLAHDAGKAWETPLGARDARIMQACYKRRIRHKDIGAGESISEARVSQRVTRALAAMRSHLTGEPPAPSVPRATAQALWKQQCPAQPTRGGSAPNAAPGEGSLP